MNYTLTPKEAQAIIIHRTERMYSTSGVRMLLRRNKEKIKQKKVLGRIMINRESLIQFIKENTHT